VSLDDKALKLTCVGYGVSQALPVVELLERPPGAWFAIQQPEVHLHPRAEAAVGDMFFRMAATENKRLLVETHSDFTIDRFRMNYRKAKGRKPESQILFFERRDKHNTVTSVPIDGSGELPEDQPLAIVNSLSEKSYGCSGTKLLKMCVVVDANCLSRVFDPKNVEHEEFRPIWNWIYKGHGGRMIYVGTKS
jgi:AAA domain, putative AbiEii toxin, Type IV TA system